MVNSESKRSKHSSSKSSKHNKTREKSTNDKKNTKNTIDSIDLLQSEKSNQSESLINSVPITSSITNAHFPIDALFGLLPATSSLHNMSLTEPMRFVTESHQNGGSESLLQRMKEIDVKLLHLQQNKIKIEEKILQLQKDKIANDQNTMQLQNERFLLLGSLLSSRSDSNVINQPLVPLTINTKPEKTPQKQKDVGKISVVSPNSINKSHQNSIKNTEQIIKKNDNNTGTTGTNSMKRVLGIVDMTKDLSAYIKNKKRKHSASQKTKQTAGERKKISNVLTETKIVDDHNYAENINEQEQHNQPLKRKKMDNQPIDEPNVKLCNFESKQPTKSKNVEKSSSVLSKTLKNTDTPNTSEKLQGLTICLTPIQKLLPSYVQEISDSDTDIRSNNNVANSSSSTSNRKELKRQQRFKNKRKNKTKSLNQKQFSSNKMNTTTMEHYMQCYVKLTRIKSSDYLLNFRGFELSNNVLVPHSSELSDVDDLKLQSDVETSSKYIFDGQLFGHKSPISFIKVRLLVHFIKNIVWLW